MRQGKQRCVVSMQTLLSWTPVRYFGFESNCILMNEFNNILSIAVRIGYLFITERVLYDFVLRIQSSHINRLLVRRTKLESMVVTLKAFRRS